MSDFTFSCNKCGQHIACDASNAGMQVACPGCQAILTVPPAPQAPAALSIAGSQARHTASEAAHAHANTSFATQYQPVAPAPGGPGGTSGLAIASFICSLFLCVGCIPGIICGHLARRKMSRYPALTGNGFAITGLILSYLSLISMLGIGLLTFACMQSPTFMKGFREGYAEARERREARLDQTITPEMETNPAADPLWNLNLTTAEFPDRPAAGKIHGQDFIIEAAKVQNGIITLRQGQDSVPDRVITIFTFVQNGQSMAGKNFDISPANSDPSSGTMPHVHINWRDDGPKPGKPKVFRKDYALKLQIGDTPVDGKLLAKIYLCLPDDEKSYVAGSFDLEVKTPPAKSKKTKKSAN